MRENSTFDRYTKGKHCQPVSMCTPSWARLEQPGRKRSCDNRLQFRFAAVAGCFIFIYWASLMGTCGAGEASSACPHPRLIGKGWSRMWAGHGCRLLPAQMTLHSHACLSQISESECLFPFVEGKSGTYFLSKNLNQIILQFINVSVGWAGKFHLYSISLTFHCWNKCAIWISLPPTRVTSKAFFAGTSRG